MEFNFYAHKEYSHMTKLQLTILLAEIERQLGGAIERAKTSSREFSSDSASYLPFEVGHLSGSIKGCLDQLQRNKK